MTTKGEMIYGSLVITTHTAKQHTKTWIVQSAFGNGGWFNVMGKQYVRPETVGQFTGLKDKNGKEIYEGDIVRFTNHVDEIYNEEIGVCVFDQDESNFVLQRTQINVANYPVPKTIRTIYLISNITHNAFYEVIGNLHQSPELVKP